MRELIYKDTARRIISSPRSKWQMLNVLYSIPAVNARETEPLTDSEQRIFLAAMTRETKACKKLNEELSEELGEPWGEDLITICKNIERKVKKALWT